MQVTLATGSSSFATKAVVARTSRCPGRDDQLRTPSPPPCCGMASLAELLVTIVLVGVVRGPSPRVSRPRSGLRLAPHDNDRLGRAFNGRMGERSPQSLPGTYNGPGMYSLNGLPTPAGTRPRSPAWSIGTAPRRRSPEPTTCPRTSLPPALAATRVSSGSPSWRRLRTGKRPRRYKCSRGRSHERP